MPGTGFTSISDYLNANQGTLDRERAALRQYVGGEQQTARSAADALIGSAVPGQGDYTAMPGYSAALDQATKANTDRAAVQTQGGVADLLQRIYGGTTDAAQFDAGLLGGQKAPGDDLANYLNTGLRFASEQPGPQNQHNDRNRGPRTPINQPPDDGQPGWYQNPADVPHGPEDAPNPWQQPWNPEEDYRNEGGG